MVPTTLARLSSVSRADLIKIFYKISSRMSKYFHLILIFDRRDRGWRKDDVMTSGILAASNNGLFKKMEARAREEG